MRGDACEWCGKSFEMRHPTQKYCGTSCRGKAARRRGGERMLERNRQRDRARYASRVDYFKRRDARAKAARHAARWAAAAEAVSAAPSLLLAPPPALPTRSRRWPSSRVTAPRTFTAGACGHCGQVFVAQEFKADYSRHRYCSSACTERASRRFHRHRRRARKQGGERILPRLVYRRDGWRCMLCGDPINRDAAVPHPLAATIDHVIPLASGGEHTYANVQTAHFICNSKRGAAPLDPTPSLFSLPGTADQQAAAA